MRAAPPPEPLNVPLLLLTLLWFIGSCVLACFLLPRLRRKVRDTIDQRVEKALAARPGWKPGLELPARALAALWDVSFPMPVEETPDSYRAVRRGKPKGTFRLCLNPQHVRRLFGDG